MTLWPDKTYKYDPLTGGQEWEIPDKIRIVHQKLKLSDKTNNFPENPWASLATMPVHYDLCDL